MGTEGQDDVLTADELDAIKQRIERSQALSITALPTKLSRNGRLWLFEQLERAGFERTPRVIRRPLEQQLLARIAQGPVAKTALLSQVKGSSKQQSARLLSQLVRAGRVSLVRQGRKDVVALPSACAAPARVDQLRELKLALDRLLKATRAGSQPRQLLRADVEQLIQHIPTATCEEPAQDPSRALVLQVLEALSAVDAVVFVPDLVRSLTGRLSAEQAKHALLALAREQRLELRPESASGLLGAADATLCPVGAGEVPLSYVRLLEGGPT